MGTPFQPLPCDASGGGGSDAVDVEQVLLCDVDAAGVRLATVIMVQQYDTAGVPVGPPVPTNPATGLPYVVVGTLVPCTEAAVDVEQEILCDVQPDATAVQFIRHYVHNTDDGGLTGESFDTLADGSVYVPTGVVGSCDPYRLCTPSSDLDLVGVCGDGETPDTALIVGEGVASDSVVNDDPSADALCGGVWDRPSEVSPFEVLESFRNATYDQPGPVTQGSAPYAGLTASPGWTGSNVDTPGQGWLQTSDINGFTNGIWQVPNPFSTADGMTAQLTFASHDGTQTPNGDGMVFAFTDGSVPPQSVPIGGGGSLGIYNWQGGYAGIVLDEYGGVCGGNRICISGVGPNAGIVAASVNVAPHSISADTDRPNPGRLITSIITEGGQTYMSASILWFGDAEPTLYFDRVNVTPSFGVAPATLRMSLYGGSGGAFRSEHEFRDATATAAGSQQWRAFPIETDPIPPCVTSVRVEACVDLTFVEDTQSVGNGNPEAFLWLVNVATNTVLDKVQRSSQPSQVGTANTMCVDATVPVAQLANLRVYVGAETRDVFGIYGSTWENLQITVAGLGCPVTPIRTLAISAPCPIDVNIIGGTADGTPAPVTVVNTPATFEDALVCISVGANTFNGFRREVRAADGTLTVTFLSTDGVPVTPDTWRPGACPADDTELLAMCDLGTDPATPFIRRITFDGDGEVASAGDTDYNGLPYVPVGVVGPCPECGPTVLGNVCVTTPSFPGIVLPAVAVQACDGTMTYLNAATGVPWAGTATVIICPPPNRMWEEILCDAGNAGTQFRRIYNLTSLGSVVFYDEDMDAAAYVVVGPAESCAEGCSNATTLLVCDLPTGDPDGAPTVTDSGQQFIADTANADFIQRPGGGGALWTGGVINFGPDVSPGPGPITQIHRFASATLQAVPPSCTDGTVHVSGSVTVLNQGPAAGCSGAGRFRLYRVSDGAVLASSAPLVGTPAGASVTLTFAADVPAAELTTGNLAVWLDVETWQTGTCPPPDSKTWQASNFTAAYAYGQEDCETQFFRTVITDCETGATLATVDTTPAGAPYVVTGDVGQCTPGSACPCAPAADSCTACQTLSLCDFGAEAPVLITGISTGGTLSNGVVWSGARGSAALFNPQHNNVDGSWWGMPAFPNATVAPDTWFFDRPVDVEFSVVIAHSFGTGSGPVNQVQVPIGSELISSAPDYSYDVATGIVTVDSSNNGDCTKVTNPTVANSARFVLRNVTQFTLDFLGQRIAICGQFSNWRFGSISVAPATTTFLRTICRDCDGAVTTVTDTEPDGTTPYVPIGPVGDCGTPADAEARCFATQICVQPQGVEEFISNEANLTSTPAVPNVDPVWEWSNDPVAGPWFDMYDVGVFPGWVTVDPGTTQGVANWVAPHPNSSPNTSGLAGEGPTIGPGNSQWYARAQFTLPPDADPASIRIAATVLNADQLGVEFRLNAGAWQPVNASHVNPPFSFPAQVIPGAQAGLNEVIVHVSETVFGSGAAGVKMHLIASYNQGDPQSWTQIVCDDGTVSYFTNAGEQVDALPEDWVIVPCGGGTATTDTSCCPTILSEGCTNTGSGRYVAIRLADGTISLVDAVTGAAIVAANVVSCPGDAIFTVSAEGRLLTAAQVWTPGADVVGTLTGVTMTVLTGTANYLDASGTAVGPLPAGFTASWNLSDDGNVLTGPQSITAAAASTVHVGWTRR